MLADLERLETRFAEVNDYEFVSLTGAKAALRKARELGYKIVRSNEKTAMTGGYAIDAGKKTIYVTGRGGARINPVMHEVGHAIDASKGGATLKRQTIADKFNRAITGRLERIKSVAGVKTYPSGMVVGGPTKRVQLAKGAFENVKARDGSIKKRLSKLTGRSERAANREASDLLRRQGKPGDVKDFRNDLTPYTRSYVDEGRMVRRQASALPKPKSFMQVKKRLFRKPQVSGMNTLPDPFG